MSERRVRLEFRLHRQNEEGALKFDYAPILFVRADGAPHSLVALNEDDWKTLGSPELITLTVEERV